MSDYTPSIRMQTTEETANSYTIVRFIGDIDKAGLAAIKDDLDSTIEGLKTGSLVFDFQEMNFINSEGIGYLLTVYYRLLKKEKKLYLVNCSERVKDVLNVIGMTKIVECYDSLETFEKSQQI
jgi:anti-anti-sigma factor